jgi:hypothetical protein
MNLRILGLITGLLAGAGWCRAERPDPAGHWAYQPVAAVTVPEVRDKAWPRSAVDAFFVAKMEAEGLSPAPDAAPGVLGRRAFFALTGLPPEPEQVLAFEQAVADMGMDAALAGLVDRLLASPHFGETWAQHWMDVVRYADGKGSEYDYPISGAWRYRDYLVRAWNADLPYDQFLREHLSGDLQPPRLVEQRNEALLATSWWQLGEAVNSPVDLAQDEAERMENTIDTLGKAFQGLTLSCARCHDHKLDPVSMRDYYALYGMIAGSPVRRTWANDAALQAVADELRASRSAFEASQSPPPPGPLPAMPATEGQRVRILGDFAGTLPAGWLVEGTVDFISPETAIPRGVQPGLWSGLLSRKMPAWLRSPAFTIEQDYIDILATGEAAMIQVIIDNYLLIKDPLYGSLKVEINHPGTWRWHRIPVGRWKGQRCVIELHTGKTLPSRDVLGVEDKASSQLGLRAVWLTDGPAWPAPAWDPLPAFPRWPGDPTLEARIPAAERFLGISEADAWDVAMMKRGDPHHPLPQKAARRYLDYFPALQQSAASGSGRRELAEAILARDNPLTLRVYVNRLWHSVFGRGIVATVDNFGHLGTPPSHPEALDFLVRQFQEKHHLQTKAALRELMLSRLWRQASLPPPAADPDNKWLSVFPLRRLEAESIRDSILAAGGSLDPTLGGPPVPVPHEIVGELVPPDGPVDGQCRRSLYLERRRNFPQRFLAIFDRPPPQATKGSRDVTNVPAQALALLNDPFVIDQARRWGARVSGAPGPVEERLGRMHFQALGRPATEEEKAALAALLGNDPQADDWALIALSLFNQKEFIYVR